MGLRDFLLFPFRAREYTIDWDSPELAPINGVSLQTFVEVTQSPMIPGAGGGVMAGMAERAGVPLADWTQAQLGWQARQAQSQMVRAAVTTITRPGVPLRRRRF